LILGLTCSCLQNKVNSDNIIGKQGAMSLEIWHIPTIVSVVGYSCVWTTVGSCSCDYSVLSTWFNTCLPYFKVKTKITLEFAAICSLFTYSTMSMTK